MTIEHGVDGAAGGNLNLTRKAAQQAFANFARAPVRLLAFKVEDGCLHLRRQLVAVTPGPARTVRQGLQTRFFVAVKNLVAGLARDSELPTQGRHLLPFQQTGDKTKTFLHNRTLLPRHHFLPSGRKCHLCVRYKLSPMCQAAHASAFPVHTHKFSCTRPFVQTLRSRQVLLSARYRQASYYRAFLAAGYRIMVQTDGNKHLTGATRLLRMAGWTCLVCTFTLGAFVQRCRAAALPQETGSAAPLFNCQQGRGHAPSRRGRGGAGAGGASSRRPRLLPPGPSSLFHRRVRIPLCELVRLVRRTWKFSPGATRAGGRFDHLARSRRHRAKSQATQLLQLGAVRFAGWRLPLAVLAIAGESEVIPIRDLRWLGCGNCQGRTTGLTQREQLVAQKQRGNDRST